MTSDVTSLARSSPNDLSGCQTARARAAEPAVPPSDESSEFSTGEIIVIIVVVVMAVGIVVLGTWSFWRWLQGRNANTRNSQRANGAVDNNAVNDLSDGDINDYGRKNDRDLEKGLAIDKRSKTEAEPFMRKHDRRPIVGVRSNRADVQKQRVRPQKNYRRDDDVANATL